MMARPVDPQLKERVLTVAERLFNQRGYTAVSMQDLAEVLGVRKASLYHYAPEGKEQLFLEVTQRQLVSHGAALRQNIDSAGINLESQLRGIATWAIAHAPLGLLAMQHMDLPALAAPHRVQVERTLDEQIWQPIRNLFVAAEQRKEVRPGDVDLRTGAFLAMLDGLTFSGAAGRLSTSMEDATDELIQMFLQGIDPE